MSLGNRDNLIVSCYSCYSYYRLAPRSTYELCYKNKPFINSTVKICQNIDTSFVYYR